MWLFEFAWQTQENQHKSLGLLGPSPVFVDFLAAKVLSEASFTDRAEFISSVLVEVVGFC